MRSNNSSLLTLRLTIGAATLLLLAAASVIVLAQRRGRESEQQLQMSLHVDELERALAAMHHAANAKDSSGLAAHITSVQRRVDTTAQTVLGSSPYRDEVLRSLEHVGVAAGRLKSAATSTDPDRAAQVHTNAVAAIEAVNDLNMVLARHYSSRSSRTRALAIAINVFGGATTLFLVIMVVLQSRSVRTQQRLLSELEALTEGTPQVLLSINARGVPRRWNNRLLHSTACTAAELRAGRVTDLFAPADRPAVVQAIDRALTEGTFECELSLRCGDRMNEYAWVFYREEADAEPGLMIVGRDISDRSAAERERQETETRYRELFEQVGDAVYTTDHERIVDVNPAASTLLGYSREELIGMPVVRLYAYPEERFDVVAGIRRVGSVTDYPLRFRRKDDVIIDVLITAAVRKDASGRQIGFHGIVRDVSERKRFELELQRSESEYRGLFENATDAIIVLDPETEEVLDANARACAMYRFAPEHFIGRSMIELSVDPSRGRDYAAQTLQGTGRYLPFESLHYRSDGTIIEVEIKAARVNYKNRAAILSINRDVTERREAERKVRESEERFRLLLENVIDYAIYMLDPDGRVVSWNEGAERITGFAAEEILGHSFCMLYPPDHVEAGAPRRHLDTAAATGRSEHEDLLVGKDGRRFHAAVTLTRVIDESGTLRGFALVTRDITERKRLEQRQSELLAGVQSVATEWTKTFDAVSMPILLIDDDGLIRRANEAAQRLAGKSYSSLIHSPISSLDGEPWRTIAGVVEFYRTHHNVTDSRAEDPVSRRVFHVASTPVDLNGEKRLIIALHELTLLKRLEESLRQTEITAALGAVVAGVAHEVRNPLFTISATLDSWEARMGETPQFRRYLDPLREEIDRMNRLMQELLDYGKPHELSPAPVMMRSVVTAAIAQNRLAIDRAKVDVVIEAPAEATPINVDEGKMQQVFRNLIENAVQHSPAGSTVSVSLHENAFGVVAEVIDHGRGLSPTDMARAFVPFYTRRKGGTGLGLPIVRRIVIAHGGEISLRNGEGGGTIVTVRIPRASLPEVQSVRVS